MSDRSFFPIIEHLKSGLSISSHSGCSLSCAYCLLHTGKNDDNYVQFVEGADAIINRLKEPQSLFLNGMTPLFINNRTDPFLPEVEKYTFQILDML
jgi:DNA repair photolyase